MRATFLFPIRPMLKPSLIQHIFPSARFCDNRYRTDDESSMNHRESLLFGSISDESLLGLTSPANTEDKEEDQDICSLRKKFLNGIRIEANQIFQILQQDGPGFNAREALDALEMKISPALVREVLLQILISVNGANKQRCSRLCYKFFVWAGQAQGYRHTPNAYNLAMKIFAESEELKAMWRLVDEMIQNGLPVTPRTFNILIGSCGEAGMARKVVERFIKSQFFSYRPYKNSFNAILHSLIIMAQYKLIEWVYQQMLLEGYEPDVLTYNIVLCAKFRLGKLDQFHRLLDEMRDKGMIPDLHTYNLLLHVLGKGDKPLAAVELLNYMMDVGCHPSVLHFTNLIDGLSRAGNLDALACEFEKAQELFDQMLQRGQLPNVFTYNSMIRGLCLSGRFDDACAMLKNHILELKFVKGCYVEIEWVKRKPTFL